MEKKKYEQNPSRKNQNITRLELSGFPVSLKKEIEEICEDEISTITSFVKNVLRREVNTRKGQLAPSQFRQAS